VNFQVLLDSFQLLDGKMLAVGGLGLPDALRDFKNLFIDKPLLTLRADWNFLELTVPDNNGVVISGRDTGSEFLPFGGFKFFLCCYQDVCRRVQS